MKRIALSMLVVFIIMMAFGATAQAENKKIKMGVLQWSDQLSVAMAAEYTLERMGYEVEQIDFFEWGIAFAALERGDIDLMPSLINFCAQDYWERSKEKLEKIGVPSFGMAQGLVVPSYVPIDSIDQINSIKDKIGGKIIGIEPGAGLMRQVTQQIEGYGLDVDLAEGSTAAMSASLKSAIAKKKWIVTMLWTPSWMVQTFDVKFLKDPKGIGQPPQAYHYLGRKGFRKEMPFASEVLAGIFLTVPNISDIALSLKDGKKMPEAWKIWLSQGQNQAVADAWMVIGSPDRY
jgi:glycine betaine/proline transport system substrate-binding protein